MWRTDLRRARTAAVAELRASWRRLTGSWRRVAGLGVSLLMFGVAFPVSLFGPATGLGRALAAGAPPLGSLGMLTGTVAIAGLYLGGASALNQNRIGDIGALVRTSMPPRAVTLGRLWSELVQTAILIVPPLVGGLVLVGYGARDPVVPLLLGVGLCAMLLTATLAGRAGGATLRYVGVLSRLGAWAKLLLFAVVMVLIFAGTQVVIQSILPDDASFLGGFGVPPFLPGRPLQAYAAAVLAPVGTPFRPLGAVVAVSVLLAVPVGLAATTRVETALLLRDDDVDSGESATRAVPEPLARWRAGRLGWRHLIGTVRDPKTLAHVFPVFMGLIPGSFFLIVEPDVFLTVGPPLLVGAGAVLAGSTYCLNPLGDDRDQLPLVLTSVKSTASLLRGRVVAGSVLGLGLAAVALAVAPLGPEPIGAIAVAASALVTVPAAAGLALGIGAFSPQFERHEYMNVERAHPSQLVLMGFMFGGGLFFGGGTFGLWLALTIALDGELAPVLAAIVWLVGLAIYAVAGLLGYGYAVSRFDSITLDGV